MYRNVLCWHSTGHCEVLVRAIILAFVPIFTEEAALQVTFTSAIFMQHGNPVHALVLAQRHRQLHRGLGLLQPDYLRYVRCPFLGHFA